jgi:GH25 family lysozyme M1 (1,4-beta-N-acetylmuramidase)
MQKGIDVWEGNGNINWDNVETDFVILRLGYIGNNENKKDKKFELNYAECKARNIPVGVYVYNYVKSIDRAQECARWVVEQLKNKSFELPIYLDMEQESITYLGKDYLTSICIAFNTIIEQAGLKAGVYANRNWFDNHLNKETLKDKYNCWIAHYGVNLDKYEGEYDLLQYSEHSKVNGISGDVDLNVMYSDTPTPTPAPTPEYTFEQFVYDVQVAEGQTGEWLDSMPGPRTLDLTPTVSRFKNKNHKIVTPLERYFKQLGYYKGKIEEDEGKIPIFGDGMEKAVLRYQADHNCVTDGEITAKHKTWRCLLNLVKD